jgi:hypothetical protein
VDVSNRTDPQPNAPAPPGGEQVLSEPPTADGLSVTVRVVPLSDHESSPLRTTARGDRGLVAQRRTAKAARGGANEAGLR